jgi:hypothetical protein
LLDETRLKVIQSKIESGKIDSHDVKLLMDDLLWLRSRITEANGIIEELFPYLGNISTNISLMHMILPTRLRVEKYVKENKPVEKIALA